MGHLIIIVLLFHSYHLLEHGLLSEICSAFSAHVNSMR